MVSLLQNLYLRVFYQKNKLKEKKILFNISKRESTTIIYESPHRINKLLVELSEPLWRRKEIQLSRELTKKFEEHIGSNIDEVMAKIKHKEILGEITLAIKGIKNSKNPDFNKSILKKNLMN